MSNILNWDEYFMLIAKASSLRSKDPVMQVGACIVDQDHHIISTGYNGFPKGCSDEEFPWGKGNPNDLDNKFFYVVHAEQNAILNAKRDLTGCSIYVTLFPCNECAKFIIQSGIKEVVYDRYDGTHDYEVASYHMLSKAGVSLKHYMHSNKDIVFRI